MLTLPKLALPASDATIPTGFPSRAWEPGIEVKSVPPMLLGEVPTASVLLVIRGLTVEIGGERDELLAGATLSCEGSLTVSAATTPTVALPPL
jgi:hypothetical protein